MKHGGMRQQHHIPDNHIAMTWCLLTPTCCRIKTWAPLRGRGSSPTRSSICDTQGDLLCDTQGDLLCDTQGDLLCATKTKQLSNIFVSCVSSLSVLWNKRNILQSILRDNTRLEMYILIFGKLLDSQGPSPH